MTTHERRFLASRDERSGYARILAEEATHAIRVLRLEIGAEVVCIFNDERQAFNATIESIDSDEILCKLSTKADSSSQSIVECVLIAQTKPAINELIVEKLSELGVGRILFYKAERSHVEELSGNKLTRLEKISVSAAKQSGRAFLTEIITATSLSNALALVKPESTKIALLLDYPEKTLDKCPRATHSYAAIVGPAGDFSPNELEELLKANWSPLYLGNIRLREETAAIVGVSMLAARALFP